MGGSYGLGPLVARLAETAFALSATAPGTAAAVGLCCALLVRYY
ncbi:hypothetical protein [Halorarius litoreus]|nr:hypothetical protein [Halorarius litoreus]